MNTDRINLKNKIIDWINSLSYEKLLDLEQFLGQLETKNSTKESLLSLAGAWKDMDEEVFKDLTENLPHLRKEGIQRIQ